MRIAGITAFSTVDWPGHLVATVFCQGCGLDCCYCHNRALIPARAYAPASEPDLFALLARRRGLLDGVVFSGGEALLQPDLASVARRVRDLGFGVGLHSAGFTPRALERVLAAGVVDWLGLDIKAWPGDYRRVTGRDVGARAWRSLDLATACPGLDLEVRLTVYPSWPGDAVALARAVRERGVAAFALQVARPQPAGDSAWARAHQAWAEQIADLGFTRFAYRL